MSNARAATPLGTPAAALQVDRASRLRFNFSITMKNTQSFSRRHLPLVIGFSFLLFGFSMPGCGSDPAVKQQVEGLTGKVTALEQQLKVARDESAITQKRLEEMAAAMTSQSEAMNRLQARLDAAQLNKQAAAKGASKPGAVTKKPAKALPKAKKGAPAKKKGH